MVWGYLLSFLLDIRIGKKKLNVRLAGDNMYGKLVFTLLSMVMSLMASYFVLFFSHEMYWMKSGTDLVSSREFSHLPLCLKK